MYILNQHVSISDEWRIIIQTLATSIYLMIYISCCIMSHTLSIMEGLTNMFPNELLIHNQWKSQLMNTLPNLICLHNIKKNNDVHNNIPDNATNNINVIIEYSIQGLNICHHILNIIEMKVLSKKMNIIK